MKAREGVLNLRMSRAAVWLAFVGALACSTVALAEEPRCYYVNLQTLPIKFNGATPIVEGSIDGKPIRMLVDSGAYETKLFQHAAERLGLRVLHSSVISSGVGGKTANYRIQANDFRIGPLKGKRTLNVIRQYAVDKEYADGIVGAEILFQTDLEMSLTDRSLKFFSASGCGDTMLSYWDQNASAIPLHVGGDINGQPEIDININGKTVRAMVDSGAASSVIDLKTAARVGVTPKSPDAVRAGALHGVGEEKSDAWIAPFSEVVIGGELIKNAKIRIGDLRGNEMLLGADFLRSHRVLFAVSQSTMYFSYLGGNVFRTSDKDDLTWYQAAAQRGDADAQYQLGVLYMYGSSIPHDAVKAVEWFSKAAEKGDDRAQMDLGLLYERGDGVAKDPAQAFNWYRKSAENGNVYGQHNLARAYENGLGVQKDLTQAIQWYRKAAEKGSPYAQARMGVFHLQGKGVPKDAAAGKEWLSKATADGKPGQYWNLGKLLFGQGMYQESIAALEQAVDKDAEKAYPGIWLYLAKARGGAGSDMKAQLESGKGKWKEGKWTAALADFYLDRVSADGLMKLARDADKKIESERICEANFYIAQRHLINRETKPARQRLQEAVQGCPRNFIEYDGAVAELERLE